MIKMAKKNLKCSILREDELLDELIIDPQRSLSELARKLNKGKTSTWRRKKELEESNIIQGYTAVVDETKLGWQLYIMLLKAKATMAEAADRVIEHVKEDLSSRIGVRSIDTYFTFGEYDFVLVFAAKDNTVVKNYIDLIRMRYADVLEGRPIVLNTTFVLRKEGIVNPEINSMKELLLPDL